MGGWGHPGVILNVWLDPLYEVLEIKSRSFYKPFRDISQPRVELDQVTLVPLTKLF